MRAAGDNALPSDAEAANKFLLRGLKDFHAVDKVILDLGCGNGAVCRLLKKSNLTGHNLILGIDVSFDALALNRASTGAQVVQARLETLPIRDCSIDLLISQFALEYSEAIDTEGLARLLIPGGRCLFVMHQTNSIIHSAFKSNQEAARLFEQTGAFKFFTLRRERLAEQFEKVESLDRGKVTAFIRELDELIDDSLVGQTLSKLLEFLLEILAHPDINPSAQVQFLENYFEEWARFRQRLTSMLDAALDDESFMALQSRFVSYGLRILMAGDLVSESGQVLGYKLAAEKR